MQTKLGVILMAAVLVVAAGLLISCTTTSTFTPYEGAQKWPVSQKAPWSIVNTQMPVYYGPPPQPYIVMGLLEIGNADRRIMKQQAAATEAKKTRRRCHHCA